MFTLSIKQFFWISSQGYIIHKRFAFFSRELQWLLRSDAQIWQQASGTKKNKILLRSFPPRPSFLILTRGIFFLLSKTKETLKWKSVQPSTKPANAPAPHPRFGGSDERRIGHTLFQCLCDSFFLRVFLTHPTNFFESVFLFTESPIN